MKNKVIYLTGAGFRVFTTAATIATLAFTILLICIHEQVPAYAIAATVFVFAVCGFACFLCFNHRIIFSPEQSTIKYCALKSVVVSVADIKRTEISTLGQTGLIKFCNIVLTLKDGGQLTFSGCSSLSAQKAESSTRRTLGGQKKLKKTGKKKFN